MFVWLSVASILSCFKVLATRQMSRTEIYRRMKKCHSHDVGGPSLSQAIPDRKGYAAYATSACLRVGVQRVFDLCLLYLAMQKKRKKQHRKNYSAPSKTPCGMLYRGAQKRNHGWPLFDKFYYRWLEYRTRSHECCIKESTQETHCGAFLRKGPDMPYVAGTLLLSTNTAVPWRRFIVNIYIYT